MGLGLPANAYGDRDGDGCKVWDSVDGLGETFLFEDCDGHLEKVAMMFNCITRCELQADQNLFFCSTSCLRSCSFASVSGDVWQL